MQYPPLRPESFKMIDRRGKPLHGDARRIIYNVLTFFEQEKEKGSYFFPVEQAMDRAVAATGASLNTLRRIKKEGVFAETNSTEIKTPGSKKQRARSFQLDVIQHSLLRNIINTIYTTENEIPSVSKILDKAAKDVQFGGSKTTLRAILLKELGYKFCKNGVKKAALLEKTPSVEARNKYLLRLRQNNAYGPNRRPVIYVGETWIRCDRHKWGRSQRVYMLHAGGEGGFVKGAQMVFKFKWAPGEPPDKMNSKVFVRWLHSKLIPNMPPNCIIVMASNPYSMVDLHRLPKKATKEPELRKWLHDRNIAFKESVSRLKLVKLCQKHRPPKHYVVDHLLQSHGHEVVRLPPYNHDLNLMEYVWMLIKHRVTDQTRQRPSSNVEQLALAALAAITPNEWANEVHRVRMIEKYYADVDPLIEAQTAHFKAVEEADPKTKAAGGSAVDADSDDQEQEMESHSDSGSSEIEELYLDSDVKSEKQLIVA